jgi:glycosyltransferase involved in cell wall biosynthesis
LANLPPHFTLLQVIPSLDTGGAEQTTLDVAAAVVRDGGRALVASNGGRLEPKLASVGGELVRLPVHSKNPARVLLNGGALAKLIRRERVSVIHVRSRAPAFSALMAANRTRTPLVTTYHGVYSANSGLKRWYNGAMTRGDLVIANSDYTRDHVIAEHRLDPHRIVTVARGVDLGRFDPAAVTEDRIEALRAAWGVYGNDTRLKVLLAGRLTEWKGQRLLIEAAARLRRQGREDLLILFAGDDQGRSDYTQTLRREIAEAGLEDCVRLVGHCDDMPAAWRLVDLGAAPSTRPEAFGRTAVEPQAMGVPVLAADHGATRETVIPGETGWLVKPGDADAWAQALNETLNLGRDRLQAMGAIGQARVRRLYSVDAMTAATLDVYARVLKERGK